MIDLSEDFWEKRYSSKNTGWDLGKISTPLKMYFDQLENKNLKILIPGGGNSYEAEYIHKKGFSNVFVVDVSKTALDNIQKRVPDFPSENLIHKNFFDVNQTFDLIVEQTFFCALNPNLRLEYAKKTAAILRKKGKLIGLLFNIPLNKEHPPFGGDKNEYLTYFKPFYTIKLMENCYNSETTRKNKELFIKLIKK